jgi:hypothetical protein
LATLTRKKRPKAHDRSTARPVILKFRSTSEVEAPDQGDRTMQREAPETPIRRGRMSAPEAPDAGEGRVNALDHDFTHGRSQS